MSNELNDLEVRLEDLHRSLSSAERVDPETRQALVVLLSDIDRLLAKSPAAGSTPAAGQTTVAAAKASDDLHVDRLTEAAQRFQATHPTLAGTLSGLADALGRMGI
jgi:hypothetical protein